MSLFLLRFSFRPKYGNQRDDELPELSDDEDATLDTTNLGLEIASTFSYTDSIDEQKKATNQEVGTDESDTIIRQITQSKNLFSHQAHPESLLCMKSDFDDTILNEDIDALLDGEAPELSNDEDSIVDELINSPAKNSNLNILTKNDAATMKTLKNEEFILSIFIINTH